VTPLARAVFGVLVLATFAAFFVAQQLKSQPAVVDSVTAFPLFSPNQDGRLDRARVAFRLKRDDTVTATVIDEEADEVRTLLDGEDVARRTHVRLAWDGRTDEGTTAPDGIYRIRLGLRREGRTLTLQRDIELDTTPPQPRVLAIGPEEGDGPELLPRRDGAPAEISLRAPGRRVEVDVWRTDRGPRRVARLDVPDELEDEEATVTWDATRRGRRVAPGTYAVVVRSRDPAGNIGSNAPRPFRLRPGLRLPDPAGITVRPLAAQPPLVGVRGGRTTEVGVDSRGAPWRWSLRRVGAPEPVRRGRHTSGGSFAVRVPDGRSGLFLYEVATRRRAVRVPLAVDDRARHPVLVVLPATTWQGRNAVDDDGDGLPDTLELGGPVALNRVLAGDGLPVGVSEREAPLLAHLDRGGMRYDLTTDVALAGGVGPQLDGHQGVLLAGDTVWLTDDVRRRLRSFTASGGTLVSTGTGSLRRTVEQTATELRDPSAPAAQDAFGARLGDVRRRAVDLSILDDDPGLQLFAGGPGLFPGVPSWEPTTAVGGEAEAVSTAVTPDGTPVVVAARFGDGLVVRPGMPAFASRLSRDRATAELMGRMWTLLSEG
jgi:hypothetical protein